jgi:hypothetical protein
VIGLTEANSKGLWHRPPLYNGLTSIHKAVNSKSYYNQAAIDTCQAKTGQKEPQFTTQISNKEIIQHTATLAGSLPSEIVLMLDQMMASSLSEFRVIVSTTAAMITFKFSVSICRSAEFFRARPKRDLQQW